MELTRHTTHLPATVEELNQFILIGKEKIKAHQAKIRAINAVGMADAARRATLSDAQDLATAVIYAEAKMGELLKGSSKGTFKKGGETSLPPGLSKRTSHQARTIADNPRSVETAISQAIKNDDIPTPNKVYKLIKQEERATSISEQQNAILEGSVSSVEGEFDVIVIDPPWPYGTRYDPHGRRAANPYPEMSLEEIETIKIPSTSDCVLWMWTTHKFMRHSFKILDSWGFRDVAILTWVKNRIGLGSWLRSQSEFCIMAIKGSPTIKLTNQTTVISGEAREHSRKPNSFYSMVDGLCIGRKLDYFSREQRHGWASFGNDIKRF
jgi:N6-adenosine-specific RNA methylase IME4